MGKDTANKQSDTHHFPPVVAVLGHVDHGKTTLLDAIRKTSIADREFGGITQGIGASSVEIVYDGKKRQITFIDTPGHEAFGKMRSRGAKAADIGLLIVSAVDGVKPQTRESIQLLKDAQIPLIAVLTKVDLPTKNIEKIKQEIIREDILLEGFGGDVPVIEVAAPTGQNVKELLDLILLVSEVRKTDADVDPKGALKAIVIESKKDQRTGSKATVIVKNGTIRARDEVDCEGHAFRVRTIIDDKGAHIQEASIGQGVEIIGMEEVLPVGGIVSAKGEAVEKKEALTTEPKRDIVYHRPEDAEGISLILCADTQGSLEAIIAALPEGVRVVASKTGEITEADVLQAKATSAIVIGFNSRIRPDVQKLAFAEKILIKNYKIIYEMLDELTDVIEGKKLAALEVILGTAKILAKFPYEKTEAFGVGIVDGRLARGDKVRIMHGDDTVGETTIKSLRVGKNPVTKIDKGEAGLIFAHELDITIGDMLISVA